MKNLTVKALLMAGIIAFVVKNNGSVKLASGNDLNIPLGVNAEIPYGCITSK